MKKEILLALIVGRIAEIISLAVSFDISKDNFAFDGKVISDEISKETADPMIIRGLLVSLKSNVIGIPKISDVEKTEQYMYMYSKVIEIQELVVCYCETILENKKKEENNG